MQEKRSMSQPGVSPDILGQGLRNCREILDQSAFHRVISLERRRTERSKKPFVLMLMDREDHSSRPGFDSKHLAQLREGMSISIRETDVVGWYRNDSTLAVLFTETNIDSRGVVIDSIADRMHEVLHLHLGVEELKRVRISFHVFPESWNNGARGNPSDSTLYPDLSKRTREKPIGRYLKRAMDILGSALALVVLSPVFFFIAILIKATSKGPILFRQQRIGQYGKKFVFLKFRSMYVGNDPHVHKEYVRKLIAGKAERNACEGNSYGVFKLTLDSRITPFGSFLRRTSLDELPQFVNVLKGDMSLVGPRPPISYEVETYELWHRRRLIEAKPGITGLWQVGGRSRLKFDEMVRLDLEYARTWSLWIDIKILLRTPLAVLLGEGAH
jgi:lipopolysaccharide/colanic/teichoic acid biosynthesis glycosyltransferase